MLVRVHVTSAGTKKLKMDVIIFGNYKSIRQIRSKILMINSASWIYLF